MSVLADVMDRLTDISSLRTLVTELIEQLIFPRFDGHFSMIRNQGVRDEWKDTSGVRAGVQAADC